METTIITQKRTIDTINVFLVGNNPIDLSHIYVKLKAIRNTKFNTEIGFDMPGIYQRISKFKPDCVVIDDNIQQSYLKKLLDRLSTSSKTKHIPVAVIKNNNYGNDPYAGVHDFILKENITDENLSNTIINAIRIKKMHKFDYAFLKRRKFFLNFF